LSGYALVLGTIWLWELIFLILLWTLTSAWYVSKKLS
jgi:hypothetical protein